MSQWLWTQKQDIGPSARALLAMVYEAARKRGLLFGGLAADNATHLNDTWECNGENWTQVADIGPSGRSRHAMANDSARARVVLFGGAGRAGCPECLAAHIRRRIRSSRRYPSAIPGSTTVCCGLALPTQVLR